MRSLAVCLVVWGLTQTALAAAERAGTAGLRCEVVYLPQRHTWVREVTLVHDARRLKAVHIDGVPVHTFTLVDRVVRTSLDNERIQLDLGTATWRSDFRGQASGQGRCDPLP